MLRHLLTLMIVTMAVVGCSSPPPSTTGDSTTPDTTSEAISETQEPVVALPDRPSTAEAIAEQSIYRQDPPEAVGSTGRPQVIIFYDTYDPIDDSECAICLNVRDDLHQLEADFFDRADFIYLQRRLDGTSAVADAYGVRLKYGIQMLVVDAEGDLLHKFYELPIENEGLGSTAGDLKVQQLTVSLNRLLGEKVGG